MKPEEIFRFVHVRPAQRPSDKRVSERFARYSEVAKSPFHLQIEQLQGPDTRAQASALARARLNAADPVAADLAVLLDAAEKGTAANTAADARKAVERCLGQSLSDYLKSAPARALKDALWDRLYAHTLVPEERPESRDLMYAGVRAFHYLEQLAKQKEPGKALTRTELEAVSAIIPKSLIPESPTAGDEGSRLFATDALDRLATVHAQFVRLEAAIEEVQNANRVHRAQQLQTVADFPPNEAIRITDSPATLSESTGAAAAATSTVLIVPKRNPWLFTEFGERNLSKETLELLSARKSKLNEMEVAEVVGTLEHEKYELVGSYLRSLPPSALEHLRSSAEFAALLARVPVPGFKIKPALALAGPAPGSAAARGIQPLGLGDLLVVKQTLLRYVAGEVAHIENVLKSEFKTRTDTRLREVEEILITETEELEETEKDLQSTERFELHKESQKTIEEQMSLQAGVSVTGSYGPVSVSAHADFALNQSSSETNSTASTFAKEVTEKSVSRIMRRSREQRTRRTLERYEEKNEHGFDNKQGPGHVIGIYRWVDKYYKARLVNWGRRLMFEFIVPEPAAFYLNLQADRPLPGVTLTKPTPPMVSGRPLLPTDLARWNIDGFVALYNVQDVEACPADVVHVSAAFAEAIAGDKNADYAKTSEKLSVPAGYKCFDVFGYFGHQGYPGNFAECLVAGQQWGSVTASGLQGIIPISIKGWLSAFHVNIVASCELKPESLQAWQLKSYAAIMNAYEKALADYNEQVASAQIQAGVQIQGRNPGFNRKIESEELKKGALRLLTDNFAQLRVGGAWRFNEMFDAMQSNGQFGYPEFNIDEATVEGRILQFFEQAFEWNNMTYRFYPYFWGRKSNWDDNFSLTDTDPQFADFLRAGAARVIIPAHPKYNEMILHYLSSNEIWNGGSPPTIDDPLYISIIDELKSDAGADLDGVLPACSLDSGYPCLADEWEIKLPTTLVYLQPDNKLPDFTV
ncbi:MAG: hypothetical protein ABUT39_04970 [Acidobacteriota bacterium]